VECGRFDHIRAEFLPRVAFGENGVAQGTRAEAAGFVVADFEDQFHFYRIAFDWMAAMTPSMVWSAASRAIAISWARMVSLVAGPMEMALAP